AVDALHAARCVHLPHDRLHTRRIKPSCKHASSARAASTVNMRALALIGLATPTLALLLSRLPGRVLGVACCLLILLERGIGLRFRKALGVLPRRFLSDSLGLPCFV